MFERIMSAFIIQHDKALHIIYGAAIYAVSHLFLPPMFAMAAVLFAATAKEIYDSLHKDKHTADIYDAVATAIGGMLGLVCGVQV